MLYEFLFLLTLVDDLNDFSIQMMLRSIEADALERVYMCTFQLQLLFSIPSI